MKISEVYKKYNVPPNLEDHMLTVTKVAMVVCKHWKGEELDSLEIRKSALLHDLANIVRFDFDNHPEFLGNEVKNIELWRIKQKETIEKYGSDDHIATQLMLNELNFNDDSMAVISSKSFANSVMVMNSNNCNLKILLYADMRVSPLGVVSLEERMSEVVARRLDLATRPDIDQLCNSLREVEKQIQENVDMSLADVNDESIKISDKELLNMEV